MHKPSDVDDGSIASNCSASCCHPFYCTPFSTTPQEPMMAKQRLSRRELERLLYDASEVLNSVLEDCFPTTPEGVAAEEERQRREGPIELPESLRDASKVLERIQSMKESTQCEHIIVEDDCGSAVCGKCDKDFGWYCQISTKHVCEYENDEWCIHCGAPEERQ